MRTPFAHPAVRRLIELALEEDLGRGDVTTDVTVGPGRRGRAEIVAKEAIVVAGLPIAAAVLDAFGCDAEIEEQVPEGARRKPGDVLLTLDGDLAELLSVERTLLNFLQRLCGVATQAARYAEAVAGTSAKVVDTRKTLPGWRLLDKWAVRVGGAANHRAGLDDGILIKDNHIEAAGGLRAAVQSAQAQRPHLLRIEVECENLEQVEEALAVGTDAVLLDNMSVDQLRAAVALIRERRPETVVEASGMIQLDTIRGVAETGVDLISVGALTHSAVAVDLSMRLRAV